MKIKTNDGIQRNRWEEYLREYKPEGYKLYIECKKEAIKKGIDPVRHVRDTIVRYLGQEAAMAFWTTAIAKRIVEPEESDIDFLRNALAKKQLNLDKLVAMFGARKAADIICALHLEELAKINEASVYFTIDKLVRTNGSSRTAPSIGPAFFGDIPMELIHNINTNELVLKYYIDEYLEQFQKDFDSAEKKFEEIINSEIDNAQKEMCKRVLDYYREIKELEIPDIVSEIIDSETGEIVSFPALHQKIAAKFIAEQRRALIADEMGLGKTAEAIIAKNLIERIEGRKITAVAVVLNEGLHKDRWPDQISKWNIKKKKVVMITSKNKEAAFEEIEKEKPDFILVSYDMIFRKYNKKTIAEKLSEYVDYLIIDEVQNAKNSNAKRANSLLFLSKKSKYVVMLSGTPTPNRVEDMGIIASILWGHQFEPNDFNKRYAKNPRVIRELILPKMLRRTREKTFGKGVCTIHEIPIEMFKEQELEHTRILLNKERLGALELIQKLRKCSLDPRLVGIDADSPKYDKLVEILIDEYDRKSVIFSSELKKGVLGPLCEKLKSYGFCVARVDGDITGKKRNEELQRFKYGDANVLIATLKTLGEGYDLTQASRCFFIDAPFNDARFSQGISRLDRKGQRLPVDVYLLVSKNSIDELLLKLMEQKKKLQEFFLEGYELTDFEKKILERAEKLVVSGQDALRKLYRFFGIITNRNSESIMERLRDPYISSFVAEEYWKNFEGSFYGNTANLIKQIITTMKKSGRNFNLILDLASGPCCLARVIDDNIVSLDANAAALKIGQDNLLKKSGAVCANFMNIPAKDGSFDLVVFSLALLHSAPYERERLFREINRVMTNDGVLIITLPSGRYEKLFQVLPQLGFEMILDLTGTVRDAEQKRYECFMLTAIKKGEPQSEPIPTNLFDFLDKEMPVETESYEASVPSRIKRIEHTKFEIEGVGIDSAVVSAIKCSLLSKKPAVSKRKQLPLQTSDGHAENDPFTILRNKYGNDIKKIFENCPDEELERLGVVLYTNKKGNLFVAARNDDSELINKYRGYIKRPRDSKTISSSNKKAIL